MSDKTIESILEICHDTGLFLQERPLDVNDTNVFEDTPLHLVCRWGDADAVNALLAAGAKVNTTGDRGQTALFCAETPEVADLLLAAGADPTIIDEFGETAETFLRKAGLALIAAHIASRVKPS